jgi:hypothetical protein
VPTIGIQIKFPLKPSKHFMLEPYAAIDFPQNTGGGIKEFALLGIGGGFQFGVKGGEMGAFFVDANFMYNIGNIHIIETDRVGRNAFWNRWVLGFSLGYKIGFFNRNKEGADSRTVAGPEVPVAGSEVPPAAEPSYTPPPEESTE